MTYFLKLIQKIQNWSKARVEHQRVKAIEEYWQGYARRRGVSPKKEGAK